MNTIQQALTAYLKINDYPCIDLKSVLFDMDGVLYNSMPNHTRAWAKTMQAHGLNMTEEEAYLHEGRTGDDTINIISRREGKEIGPEERIAIYQDKTVVFNEYPTVLPMTDSEKMLQQVIAKGLFVMLVTGLA